MKKILIAFCLLILCACSNEKSVLLPEIQNAKITEITDVSPVYLFYDETKPDSLDLNKNNIITSTNWLVNVDKRLTLKQVIPTIVKLQEKKRNSDHKNKKARNYYTCNDTAIKNLGFIDFTDVVYDYEGGEIKLENNISIALISLDEIQIFPLNGKEYKTDITNLIKNIEQELSRNNHTESIKLAINQQLSFQDYITFKSKLSQLKLENTIINNEEYIFN